MNLITIQWASTNLPTKHRYIILNNGNTSAIYKRYLHIIYIRISKPYNNNETYTTLLTKYNALLNKYNT